MVSPALKMENGATLQELPDKSRISRKTQWICNVYEETDQGLDISGITVSYLNNPSEETIFGSNKIKAQHKTKSFQNEEVNVRNTKHLEERTGQTRQRISEKRLRKKLFLFWNRFGGGLCNQVFYLLT